MYCYILKSELTPKIGRYEMTIISVASNREKGIKNMLALEEYLINTSKMKCHRTETASIPSEENDMEVGFSELSSDLIRRMRLTVTKWKM